MRRIQKEISFLILFLSCFTGLGQTPNYYILGEKELAQADVFSILQTKSEQLFIATNQGLYKHKNGNLILIPRLEKQIGNAFFNLIENAKGEVYCCNLDGQIFQYKNNALRLFFEVPKKYYNSNSSMQFDHNGAIIFASKGFYKIENNRLKVLYENKNGTKYTILNIMPDNTLLISTSHQDSVIHLENGKVEYESISYVQNKSSNAFPFCQLIQLGNVRIRCQNGNFLPINDAKFTNNIPKQNEKYKQFSDKEVWSRLKSKGARLLHMENDTLKVKGNYFQDKFISCIASGVGETMFFGSFGQGVFVVPNKNMLKHNANVSYKNLNSIAVSKDNDVFIAENGKGVIYYKGMPRLIYDNPSSNIQNVFYKSYVDFALNTEFPSLYYSNNKIYENKFSLGAVKDLHRVNDSTVLFATSKGLKGKSAQSIMSYLPSSDLGYHQISHYESRCNTVTYDSIYHKTYLSLGSSVVEIDKKGKQKGLLFKGENISCNDLIFHNKKVWCATENEGLLVFENGKFLQSFSTKEGLKSNNIREIEIKDDRLFLATREGFQIMSLNDNSVFSFGIAEGVIGYVTDFGLSDTKLWLVTDNSHLISTPLKDLPSTKIALTLFLDSVLVSGINKGIEEIESTNFNQNQFEFFIHFKNFIYQSETQLFYRIKGFEEEWNSISALTDRITYKSLPAGTFQLECYAKYGNFKSNVITKNFVVNKPYWQTWWFYLLLLLFTSFIILLIAFYRIKLIRKNNKDTMEKQILQTHLLDTELKALRSQMNPHFIFNSLNAIQDLVLKQETDICYDYIALFANLVRRALNYSNVGFIPIKNELEFLDVYLRLEKLRFGDDFNYSITYEGDSEIEVPSLIVQPFIENAILHGLLHKDGNKKLSIRFEYTDQLICTIIDNGIGRTASKDIQNRQGTIHKSFALEAIEKRLSILSEQYTTSIGFEIIDLYNGEIAAGTKVIVKMPFNSMF